MRHFDFGIIGFGIAGLSVAYALKKSERFRDASICVVSGAGASIPPAVSIAPQAPLPPPGSIAHESYTTPPASLTPIALLNPATGREAKLVHEAEHVLSYTKHMLREIQAEEISKNSGEPFFFESGVLRPAASPEMASAMKKRLETDPWPSNWASWLNPEEILERFSGVYNAYGGLWISEGGYVDMPRLFKAARSWLEAQDVMFEDREVSQESFEGFRNSSQPRLTLDNELTFDRTIVAAGSGMPHLGLWPEEELGLHAVKGQILTLHLSEPIRLSCAVSMHGYLAPHFESLSDFGGENAIRATSHITAANAATATPITTDTATPTTTKLTVGSTFEHYFDSHQPDEKGEQRLLAIAESILPGISQKILRTESWAAIRVHKPPERKPVIARQYLDRGLWGLTGFGSKGLLLAPTAARRLVSEIEEQARASL